jgi:hypothetical protein
MACRIGCRGCAMVPRIPILVFFFCLCSLRSLVNVSLLVLDLCLKIVSTIAWVRRCRLGRDVHHIQFLEPRFRNMGDEASVRFV